jgi:hypothetical protein
MRSLFIVAIVVSPALFCACERTVINAPGQAFKITLNECAHPVFSGNHVNLCFDSVITDSRCPANVMCIWQGYAACKFSISSKGETYPFRLSTLKLPGYLSRDTVIAGYKIELLNLEPYPGTATSPIPPNKIRAELKITKL